MNIAIYFGPTNTIMSCNLKKNLCHDAIATEFCLHVPLDSRGSYALNFDLSMKIN